MAASPILCLGDSLTAGYGVRAHENYPSVLSRLLSHRSVVNAGVNGATSAQSAQQLPSLLHTHNPGLVLVGVGGNDFLRGVSVDHVRGHLVAMAEATFDHGANLVLIAEPYPDIVAALTNALYDHPVYGEVAASTGAAVFENGWSRILSQPHLKVDPIHANHRGHALFAENLAEFIRSRNLL